MLRSTLAALTLLLGAGAVQAAGLPPATIDDMEPGLIGTAYPMAPDGELPADPLSYLWRLGVGTTLSLGDGLAASPVPTQTPIALRLDGTHVVPTDGPRRYRVRWADAPDKRGWETWCKVHLEVGPAGQATTVLDTEIVSAVPAVEGPEVPMAAGQYDPAGYVTCMHLRARNAIMKAGGADAVTVAGLARDADYAVVLKERLAIEVYEPGMGWTTRTLGRDRRLVPAKGMRGVASGGKVAPGYQRGWSVRVWAADDTSIGQIPEANRPPANERYLAREDTLPFAVRTTDGLINGTIEGRAILLQADAMVQVTRPGRWMMMVAFGHPGDRNEFFDSDTHKCSVYVTIGGARQRLDGVQATKSMGAVVVVPVDLNTNLYNASVAATCVSANRPGIWRGSVAPALKILLRAPGEPAFGAPSNVFFVRG